MTCSSNTTCRPERGGLRFLILAAILAATVPFAPTPSSGQAGAIEAPGDLVIDARDLLSRGDPIGAQARLEAALQRGTPRRAIAAQMGRALLAQGKTDEARGWLEAGEFSPSTALDGFRALAELEMRDGHLVKAGNAYNRALAIAPDDAGLWVDIARFRYVGGEHLLAIEAADRALALGPDDPAALLLQAELVRDREGMVPALPLFEKALRQTPNDPAILLPYAATLGEAGETVSMLAVTRHILEIDPGNPQAFYLQAVMAARAGNYWLARRILDKVSGRLDGLPGCKLLTGVVEIASGNYTLAIEALDPLVQAQPANRRARDLLARAMFLDGEYMRLTRRFAGVAALDGESTYLKMTVARAFEQQGDRWRAAPLLDSVARAAGPPIRAVAENQPVGQLLAAGDFVQANAVIAEWLTANPGNFDHLSLAGDVALASGDASAALDYYARAATIRMTESLMTRRFQAMLMTGEMAQAAQLAESYLAHNPESVEARRAVAWLSARSGDWQRARRILQSLVADGSGRDVQLLSDLALAQIEAGIPDDAEATARRAYRLYRAHPVAAQAWGLALADHGNPGPTAEALLAKAHKMMGASPPLAQGRASDGPG